ncbi:MAG: ABC transporter permease [Blastocatellia bacterium]
MGKLKAIIKREYLTRVRTKSFILWTALSPLLMLALILAPLMLARGLRQQQIVSILDQTNDATLYERVRQALAADENSFDRYELRHEAAQDGENVEARRRRLNEQLVKGEIVGYAIVPAGVFAPPGKITFYTKGFGDFARSLDLEKAFNEAIIEWRLAKEGVNPARVSELTKGVRIETLNEHGQRDSKDFWLSFALLLLLYMMIWMYGLMVMQGIVEEKQSRIVEVLLSSVKPFQLMLGKLIGIGLASLTQVMAWSLSLLALSLLSAAPLLAASSIKVPRISTMLIVFFVVYFVLGYFLYSSLFAIVGAMVSTEADAQQAQAPVTIALIIPLLLLLPALRNPNSLATTILSLVPFFSPIMMFARMTIQQPPWWQIALSLVLMVGALFGAVWAAAKIYRVGVLMYGKPPTLPELAKWLKYS